MIELAIALFLLGLVALGISLHLDLKRYEALEKVEGEEEALKTIVYGPTEVPKRKRGRPRKVETA